MGSIRRSDEMRGEMDGDLRRWVAITEPYLRTVSTIRTCCYEGGDTYECVIRKNLS